MAHITPEELLEERPREQDMDDMRRLLARFQSVTGFLFAAQHALLDWENFKEAEAVRLFRNEFAKVEAAAMNEGGSNEPGILSTEESDDEPPTIKEPFLSAQTERPLPLLRDNSKYSRVEDGELINAGDVPKVVSMLYDYLGAPPSPNGE